MNKCQSKIISASILSANFAMLGEEAKQVIEAGADWIHIDVMDNHFVPNLTFGPIICNALNEYLKHCGIKATFDVHLIANNVDRLIIESANAGANYITIHPESTANLHYSLELIRDKGARAGIAINPETPIEILNKVYKLVDLILIMSVNPGFAGQKFIDTSLNKIKSIKNLIDQLNPNIRTNVTTNTIKNTDTSMLLAIDGGINHTNIKQLAASGINVFVVGSSIFTKNNNYLNNQVDNDYKKNIQLLRASI